MDKLYKYSVWKKPDTKQYILYNLTYMKFNLGGTSCDRSSQDCKCGGEVPPAGSNGKHLLRHHSVS